jgi:hypothetical protein
MLIRKFMALLLFCAPIAASHAGDLVDVNVVNGGNDQFQLPNSKAEARKYLARRVAEGLGILPKMEHSFALEENKRATRSLDFKATGDPRESWREIEYSVTLKDSAGGNNQTGRSLEFKANADLRTSWRIEFRMTFM